MVSFYSPNNSTVCNYHFIFTQKSLSPSGWWRSTQASILSNQDLPWVRAKSQPWELSVFVCFSLPQLTQITCVSSCGLRCHWLPYQSCRTRYQVLLLTHSPIHQGRKAYMEWTSPGDCECLVSSSSQSEWQWQACDLGLMLGLSSPWNMGWNYIWL